MSQGYTVGDRVKRTWVAQALNIRGNVFQAWAAQAPEGHAVGLSVRTACQFVGLEMTPDEALALAAALERAAFAARRMASIGTTQAEAETGFRPMSPEQVKARSGLLSGAYWTEVNPAKG